LTGGGYIYRQHGDLISLFFNKENRLKGLILFPKIGDVYNRQISLRVHYFKLEYLATAQNMRYLSYATKVDAEYNA
jgi:hypothetical protein